MAVCKGASWQVQAEHSRHQGILLVQLVACSWHGDGEAHMSWVCADAPSLAPAWTPISTQSCVPCKQSSICVRLALIMCRGCRALVCLLRFTQPRPRACCVRHMRMCRTNDKPPWKVPIANNRLT